MEKLNMFQKVSVAASKAVNALFSVMWVSVLFLFLWLHKIIMIIIRILKFIPYLTYI